MRLRYVKFKTYCALTDSRTNHFSFINIIFKNIDASRYIFNIHTRVFLNIKLMAFLFNITHNFVFKIIILENEFSIYT